MSRSSTPDTQIWKPALADADANGRQILRPLSTDTQETQIRRRSPLPHKEARRRSSIESFDSTDSLDLEQDAARRWETKHGWSARMAARYNTQTADPRDSILSISTDGSYLDSDDTWQQVKRTQGPPVTMNRAPMQAGLSRRSSVESFQTTGSFALDTSTAHQWEIEHGWKFLPSTSQTTRIPERSTPNFSRPLRIPIPSTNATQASTYQSAVSVITKAKVTAAGTPLIAKSDTATPDTQSGAPSSRHVVRFNEPGRIAEAATFEFSRVVPAASVSPSTSNRPPISTSTAPVIASILRPATFATGQQVNDSSKTSPTRQSLSQTESRESTRQTLIPNQPLSRLKDPILSKLRLNTDQRPPNKKHVSFEAPASSASSLDPRSSTPTSGSGSTAGSSTSSIRGTHQNPLSSLETIRSLGSTASNSINGGSSSSAVSVSTQVAVEKLKVSNFDTSALSDKEIAKLKKKGIDPALYLEMKAATKGQKTGRLKGAPLVGNSFIG